MHKMKKMVSQINEAIVLQWPIWNASWNFNVVKKQWTGALLSAKYAAVQNHERVMTNLYDDDDDDDDGDDDDYFGPLPTFWFECFFMPLGIETLEDE